MKLQSMFAAGAAAAALIGLAGAANAAADPAQAAKPKQSCFFISNWQNWHAPDDKTLYLRVNVNDIYKVDLKPGTSMLTWPDSHLVNVVRGSSTVCSPIDLDLDVSDGHGFREHLFVTGISKLTKEEVAAIPRKDLP